VCVCHSQTQKELEELHLIVQELQEKLETTEHEVTAQVRERCQYSGRRITLYRMVMPIGTPFLKEKINN